MTDVVNLRTARKQRRRAADRAGAAARAAASAEATPERRAREAEADRMDRRLDGHRRTADRDAPDTA